LVTSQRQHVHRCRVQAKIRVFLALSFSHPLSTGRLRLKCDGTCAETRFCLSAKRTSPFKSPGASVQSPTGSRGVRISGSNAGYTLFRGSVKGTGYPIHSPISPSLSLPCVTVCRHISTGVYPTDTHLSGAPKPAWCGSVQKDLCTDICNLKLTLLVQKHKKGSTEITFLNARCIFPCGNESATR